MNEQPILEARDIHAGYGKAAVLSGISLDIRAGQQITVLGPNGSGKSTMAKTLMGLTTLYRGNILWKGREISQWSTSRRARLGIGYVPQLDNTFPSLTVEENLLAGDQRLARKVREERIDEQYELFPRLRERRRVLAGQLSGGERRMLALGSALMRKPDLLVLDEPTSDLAPTVIDLMFDTIAVIRDTLAVPLVIVEQNVQRALEIADYVYILIRGQVILERPATDISVDEVGDVFMEHVLLAESDRAPGRHEPEVR